MRGGVLYHGPIADRAHILGIESSCDETAAAVVAIDAEGGLRVRANVVASQHDLHAEYGGVVPEIASRAHLERILPVVDRALSESGVPLEEIGAVAAGVRPGLIGSLLVGASAAKALAWARGVPFHAVDHVAAHLFAGFLADRVPPEQRLPALGLVVSGGHTSLFAIRSATDLVLLGRTIDDAVGEALDKAATMLGLPHPGGPNLERCAAGGNGSALAFAMPRLEHPLDLSLSGLKTKLLYEVRGVPVGRGAAAAFPKSAAELEPARRADLAASFQRAAFMQVVDRLERATADGTPPDRSAVGVRPRALLVGGGVVANGVLREMLASFAARHGLALVLPEPAFCGDNAAMIAGLAALRRRHGDGGDDLAIPAEPVSLLARGEAPTRRVARP